LVLAFLHPARGWFLEANGAKPQPPQTSRSDESDDDGED